VGRKLLRSVYSLRRIGCVLQGAHLAQVESGEADARPLVIKGGERCFVKDLFPTKNTVRLLSVLLVSLLFVNCSPVNFEVAGGSNDKIVPGGPTDPEDPGDPSDPACYTDRFNQPTQPVAKLDILFVTDTSGSLNVERAAVADGIDSFVAGLSNTVDYNIAVMLGHGSTSSHSGRLYQSGSEPVVLTKSQGLATVRAQLRTKLTSVVGDADSDGGEEGLYSLGLSMIDNVRFTAAQTQGFFRADAALAVVFISDENDICAIYPSGVTPVVDPDGKEVTAKARDCTDVTTQNVYLALKGRKDDKPLLVSSLIYTPTTPFNMVDENEIGYGYKEITESSMGLMVPLGGTNAEIAQGLGNIGSLANSQLTLITKHTIRRAGQISNVSVKVDNSIVPFNFDSAIREVQLSNPGQAGSAVEVNYCVE
jgi:hypothetical protein